MERDLGISPFLKGATRFEGGLEYLQGFFISRLVSIDRSEVKLLREPN